jgi:hypothetical protein
MATDKEVLSTAIDLGTQKIDDTTVHIQEIPPITLQWIRQVLWYSRGGSPTEHF